MFQSTPPVKAATSKCDSLPQSSRVSIHAAREGGDRSAEDAVIKEDVSIHAAREGGDRFIKKRFCNKSVFQSTPPVKAATLKRKFMSFQI